MRGISDMPKALFDAHSYSTAAVAFNKYSLSPDGQRFLIIQPLQANASPPITVVVNWTAGLKK
jgi:hypothetical protein